ncbi:sarcosine oxidase subunit delta [Sandaracinobacteroides saxicola]|uniref:Sarcosine oxidase subunit delta n=1 Tax=Sandaracinobacteroides saxicola TaxID=2759707 RepID=A0A7G5II76_9SPHN|nr:sarcosine oxidase subunit delta [Sandaracinobacteroides saxicola]QMW23068.1 sarcosine oxidase subunit delta [Sandaracinobacteroides saxicola]
MLLIVCPHCGPRDQTEFSHGGEAGRVRPANPEVLGDAEWTDYLFMRTNPKGVHKERWCHSAGCRKWFVTGRDTRSHGWVK